VDYGANTGTTIYDSLPVDGTLLYAGPDDAPDCSYLSGSQAPHNGYGNFVKQSASEQGHSLTLWSGHMSAISASGASTSPGEVLGAVGSTGCSTGPHLHFAVSVDGHFTDPEALIPPGQ
jgi:murein DD-endopeptidase MepM/ murein hydrolase activator NlpD